MSDAGLILATRNAKKLAELRRILEASSVDVSVTSLSEYPDMPEVAETGATFTENALLKARAVVVHTGCPAVADDSGLCVDALNGMPGVLSARWSGGHGDDEANLRLVLAQLADVPGERRGGQFACAAALALPAGREHVTEGIMRGRITAAPRGSNGFGYDPIFVADPAELAAAGLPPGDLTNGEQDAGAKDRMSHRGKALRGLAPV